MLSDDVIVLWFVGTCGLRKQFMFFRFQGKITIPLKLNNTSYLINLNATIE